MRRVLWITTVIIVVCGLSSPAISARKPPKSICYEMDGSGSGSYDGGCIILNFKSSAMKTRSNEGANKFYHVHGAIGRLSDNADGAIFGSANWDFTSELWEGHFIGGQVDETTYCQLFLSPSPNEFFSLLCKTGSEDYLWYDTTEIDCRTLTLD